MPAHAIASNSNLRWLHFPATNLAEQAAKSPDLAAFLFVSPH
jgi:hypothetical protein